MKVKAKRGFSLIEIIISVALLAILLIPISNVVIGTTKKNKDAEIKNKVTTEAQKVLEELNSYDTLTFDAHGDFTMLNGQMVLNYDSVTNTISTINPGTVTINNDDITIWIDGVKDTNLSPTATTTAATATATVSPNLSITYDSFAVVDGGTRQPISNATNGVIAKIGSDNSCRIYNNSGTIDAPSEGTLIGTIPAANTFVIQLDKDTINGAYKSVNPFQVAVYSDATVPIKFIVNYPYGITNESKVSVVNKQVLSDVSVSYNKLPSPNPEDNIIKIGQAYNFTVTAQANSPVSKELDPSGNKVNKVLKFTGSILKNVVFK